MIGLDASIGLSQVFSLVQHAGDAAIKESLRHGEDVGTNRLSARAYLPSE